MVGSSIRYILEQNARAEEMLREDQIEEIFASTRAKKLKRKMDKKLKGGKKIRW